MSNTTQEKSIAWRLVQACGGGYAVARELGLSKNAPRRWLVTGSVPAKYVTRLCEMSGHTFKPHQVRPDVFIAPEA